MGIKLDECFIELAYRDENAKAQLDAILNGQQAKVDGFAKGWAEGMKIVNAAIKSIDHASFNAGMAKMRDSFGNGMREMQRQAKVAADKIKSDIALDGVAERLSANLGKIGSQMQEALNRAHVAQRNFAATYTDDLAIAMASSRGALASGGRGGGFAQTLRGVGRYAGGTAAMGAMQAMGGGAGGEIAQQAVSGGIMGGSFAYSAGAAMGPAAALGAAMLGGAAVIKQVISSATAADQAQAEYAAAMSAAARNLGSSAGVNAALVAAGGLPMPGGNRALTPDEARMRMFQESHAGLGDEISRLQRMTPDEAAAEFNIPALTELGWAGEIEDVFDRGPRQREVARRDAQIARSRNEAIRRLQHRRSAVGGAISMEQSMAEADADMAHRRAVAMASERDQSQRDDAAREQLSIDEAGRIAGIAADETRRTMRYDARWAAMEQQGRNAQYDEDQRNRPMQSQRFGIEQLSSSLQQAALDKTHQDVMEEWRKANGFLGPIKNDMEKLLEKLPQPAVFGGGAA